MELVLSLTSRKFRNDIRGTAVTVVDNLRIKTRRFAHVAGTSATSGKLVGQRFALGALASDSSVRVNSIIATDIASAYRALVAE